MRAVYNKIPITIRVTPIQLAALKSKRYNGSISIIVRFFLNKLINGELSPEMESELELHLAEQSQLKEVA